MRVLALTSIRSDYDLMSPLFGLLRDDPEVDFRLLVGGAHNSPSFGLTYRDIEADGMPVLARIESLLDSESPAGRVKSAGVLLTSSADAVGAFAPDLILYAGDREDTLVGAMLGGYLGIPTLHFYAGDHASDGYVDNPVRHAVSKLSTACFVSTQEHADRLRAIGECASRIFVVGSVALDKFVEAPLVDGAADRVAGHPVDRPSAILIHHPFGDEVESVGETVGAAVDVLTDRGYHVFAGLPNSDPGNSAVRSALEKEAAGTRHMTVYGNLPRAEFVSLFKQSDLIVGNSSAGILEAASIPIPAVNIGRRQRGRSAGTNVVFVDATRDAIRAGMERVSSADFRESMKGMVNPYGDGRSATRAYRLIKSTDFRSMLAKTEDPLDGTA